MNESCETCLEPTKRPAGFYDRQMPDGSLSGGLMYACESKTCPKALEAEAGHERFMAAVREARRQNDANGIDPGAARQDRIDAQITLLEMARGLHIDPPKLCNYEQGRDPWPRAVYDRYMEIIVEKERLDGT